MNVHLCKQASGDPKKIGEVLNLPEEFVFIRRALAQHTDRLHAQGADELDLAQLAVPNALDEFLSIDRVAALEAGRYFEVLFLGGFSSLNDPAQSRRIRRKGLFHEHIHTFLDRVLELTGAKAGVAGQHGYIARAQGINRLAVSVEPDKAPV